MYFYHGYALGVASTIPGKEFTEATAALSVRGGSASAHSVNFKADGIEFQSADSSVAGGWPARKGPDVWTTEASVVIQKLNILGRVTADSITAQVYSEYRTGDYEASIVVAGSAFQNLRIDGNAVQLETSNELSAQYPTYSSIQSGFQDAFSQKAMTKTLLVGRDLDEQAANTDDLRAAYRGYQEQIVLTSLRSAVLCSFVTRVNGGGGIRAWGPIISVPNFGNIYLGEVIVWPWMRCLTMFRIELTPNEHHPKGGTISGGSAGANGTGWPPGYAPF